MSLWIRSQDKEKLVKSDRIEINCQYAIEIHKSIITVGSLDNSNNWTTLGSYSTKEKSLKVLDRIQERICYSNVYNIQDGDYGDKNFSQLVSIFQMPLDSEVK